MEADAAKFIGAGLAAIGMIGAGIGVGNIWSSLIAAVGRNPAAKASVELYGWIGFAVTERRSPSLRLSLLSLFSLQASGIPF